MALELTLYSPESVGTGVFVIRAWPPVSAGQSRPKGRGRVMDVVAWDGAPWDISVAYVRAFGETSVGQKIFCSMQWMDQNTGMAGAEVIVDAIMTF